MCVAPAGPPQNVQVYSVSSRSLRIEWYPPHLQERNGNITYYKLRYAQRGLPDSDATQILIKNPHTRNFTITELDKWTEYRIWVSAGTQVGDGPFSKPVIARTAEDGM